MSSLEVGVETNVGARCLLSISTNEGKEEERRLSEEKPHCDAGPTKPQQAALGQILPTLGRDVQAFAAPSFSVIRCGLPRKGTYVLRKM